MAPPYRLGKGPVVVALQEFLAEGNVELGTASWSTRRPTSRS